MEKCKIAFPRFGNYHIALEFLFTKGLGVEYITPPPSTKKTLEIGSKYSPDYVCSPFKFNLGNYIEAIEAGANTLVQTGGVCRLGFYGELHEQILKDLGYNVKFINMSRADYQKPLTFYEEFKKVISDTTKSQQTILELINIFKEQASMVQNATSDINRISNVIQNTTNMIEENKNTSHKLSQQAEMLKNITV